MTRNLANVWNKYPQYTEENTLMVSNYYNEIEDFQRNDVIIPEYHPLMGKTDFLDDQHINNSYEYMKFLLSLDNTIGPDMRMRMEGYSYDAYCTRINKNIRYDSYKAKDDYF